MVQQRSDTLSWDAIAAILAVGRARSIRAAALGMGIAHTTLARRVEQAEAALGAVAFVRGPRGYVPTETGRAIIEHAGRMAEEAEALRRAVAGGDRSPRGQVRVTMPAAVLTHCVAARLSELRAAAPMIELEIDTGYGLLDLGHQDADVAVRLRNDPHEDLVGVRVGDWHEACYAAPDLAAAHALCPGDALPVVAWARDDAFAARAVALALEVRIEAICKDVLGQLAFAERGGVAALLPCIVGDASVRLARVAPGLTRPVHDIWVLHHSDLARSARIQAVSRFLVAALRADLDRFTGTRTGS